MQGSLSLTANNLFYLKVYNLIQGIDVNPSVKRRKSNPKQKNCRQIHNRIKWGCSTNAKPIVGKPKANIYTHRCCLTLSIFLKLL